MFNIKAWLGRPTARSLHERSTMLQAAVLLNQGVSPRILAAMCNIKLRSREPKADRTDAMTFEEAHDDFALHLLSVLGETAETPKEKDAYEAAFAARYATLRAEPKATLAQVYRPDFTSNQPR